MNSGTMSETDKKFAIIISTVGHTVADGADASSEFTAPPVDRIQHKQQVDETSKRVGCDDSDDDMVNEDGQNGDGAGGEEEEEVPAWIRYLPKKLKSSNSSSMSETASVAVVPLVTTVRPSSNPFGPTSLKARSASHRSRRVTQSTAPYQSNISSASNTDSAVGQSSAPAAAAERVRARMKSSRCNVTEASMLFSMSSL
jgi:hypothetical protein